MIAASPCSRVGRAHRRADVADREGLVDELPQIENFRQFYGSTVHNCPYCDGWECRGQPIAVIGCNQESLDLAIELLLWSKDLVLCTNGPLKLERKAVETIKRLCIDH